MQQIKIKYHEVDGKQTLFLKQVKDGDYIDLYTAEDVTIRNFESKMISLGVSMEVPEGYYCEAAPRSSTFKHHGLIMTNSYAIIDHTYNGDSDIWRMPVYKLPKVDGFISLIKEVFIRPKYVIPAGTRLCQFRLVKSMGDVEFKAVDSLNNDARGGFGSTGV
jgi:dUTP pyrophosphatase